MSLAKGRTSLSSPKRLTPLQVSQKYKSKLEDIVDSSSSWQEAIEKSSRYLENKTGKEYSAALTARIISPIKRESKASSTFKRKSRKSRSRDYGANYKHISSAYIVVNYPRELTQIVREARSWSDAISELNSFLEEELGEGVRANVLAEALESIWDKVNHRTMSKNPTFKSGSPQRTFKSSPQRTFKSSPQRTFKSSPQRTFKSKGTPSRSSSLSSSSNSLSNSLSGSLSSSSE